MWIPEKEAAQKILRKPRTLRKLVIDRKLKIAFTSVNGRMYQYWSKDIDKLLNQNAVR